MTGLISRILLIIIAVSFLCMLMSSCSTSARARRLIRQGYAKIEKAVQLDPSVIDSVRKVKDVPVLVPGDSGMMTVTPEIDQASFDFTMFVYDSNLLLIDSLGDLMRSGTLDRNHMEKVIAEQAKAIEALRKERERLKSGFFDTFQLSDSLLDFVLTRNPGGSWQADYYIKERTVIAKVPTVDVKLDGCRQLAVWQQAWFWIMLMLILLLLMVIIVIVKR